VRFALIVACLSGAIWRTSRSDLRLYFAVNLASSTAYELALLRWPASSQIYFWVFAMSVVLIFLAPIPLVWESIYYVSERRIVLLLAFFLAALLFRIASKVHLMGRNEWLSYLNASGDLFLGTAAGIGAAYSKTRKLALGLGLFWLAQSCYEFGFSLNWFRSAEWMQLNQWMPTALVAVGCLILARLSMASADRPIGSV
jgi:hypothetical protein